MPLVWKPQSIKDGWLLGCGRLPGRKNVALFRVNEEKAIYTPLAYFRNIEAANQFCRDMFGQELEEDNEGVCCAQRQ